VKRIVFIALSTFVLMPVFSQTLTLDDAINDYATELIVQIPQKKV
jgi:hypothetical protein